MKIPGYNSVAEAAKKLGMKPDTIRRYSSAGILQAEKIGWSLFFSDAEIERFSALDRKPGRPPKT